MVKTSRSVDESKKIHRASCCDSRPHLGRYMMMSVDQVIVIYARCKFQKDR